MLYFGTKNGTEYGTYIEKSELKSFVIVNEKEWTRLLKKANSCGKIIIPDVEGNPILSDPPEPSEKETAETMIAELEAYLARTDWYAIREAETNSKIPEEVRSKRASAREEISKLRELLKDS